MLRCSLNSLSLLEFLLTKIPRHSIHWALYDFIFFAHISAVQNVRIFRIKNVFIFTGRRVGRLTAVVADCFRAAWMPLLSLSGFSHILNESWCSLDQVWGTRHAYPVRFRLQSWKPDEGHLYELHICNEPRKLTEGDEWILRRSAKTRSGLLLSQRMGRG